MFTFAVLFQLVTLPVEFNASSRALKMLGSSGMLGNDEVKGARKVLTAAALTFQDRRELLLPESAKEHWNIVF